MLAIIFMQLLLGLAPVAYASPFTRPANPDVKLFTFTRPAGQATALTTTTTTTTAAPTALQTSASLEADGSRRDQQQVELRDVQMAPVRPQQRDGFATSPASTSAVAASATTAAAAAADAGDDDTAVQTTTPTQDEVAATTAAPTDNPDVDSDLAREGYSQVTFYSCEKYAAATATHCGWHEEVVHVSGADRRGGQAIGGGGLGSAAVAAAAGAVVVVNLVLRR